VASEELDDIAFPKGQRLKGGQGWQTGAQAPGAAGGPPGWTTINASVISSSVARTLKEVWLFLRWAQINGSAFHELLDLIFIKVRCERAQELLLSRLAYQVLP